MSLPSLLIINENLAIPLAEVKFRFTRSGGAGGQHVNKVETQVELHFDVTNSSALSEHHRSAILEHCKNKIDKDGVLKISVQESRSQWRNREIAVERFIAMLQNAVKPTKKRIATTLPPSAKEKRLRHKKRRSELKKMRKPLEE
jgi:ribosome-associated protein